MPRPVSDTDFSADERQQLRELRDRYERAWSRTDPIDFGDCLPPADDRLRFPALQELIKCDMEHRWRGGRPIHVEDYLQRFAELRGDSETLTQLLLEEFRSRERHGNRPALAGFRDRFPDLYPELERRVQGQLRRTDMQPPSSPA